MRNKTVEIAILCGGHGGRMGKLTFGRQKCMLLVDGRPILEHIFEQIIKAFGSVNIVLLVGHRHDDVRDYFGGHYKSLRLDYAPESVAGTRLALLGAEDFIRGSHFICMDGDEIINGAELTKLAGLRRTNLIGTLWVSPKLEIAPTHGLAMMKGRRILKIDYPPQTTSKGRAFRLMDIGFYSKKLFEYLKVIDASTITEVLKNFIKEGETVEGRIYRDNWFHFVKPEDLLSPIQF